MKVFTHLVTMSFLNHFLDNLKYGFLNILSGVLRIVHACIPIKYTSPNNYDLFKFKGDMNGNNN